MPIFEKNGERIYFAHIPKTAGSYVYILFAQNGWTIKNLSWRKGGIAGQLRDRFGLEAVQVEGDTSDIRVSLQHATAAEWARWKPVSESFAIVRQPSARFVSAIRYRYTLVPKREESFEVFRAGMFAKLKKRLQTKRQIFDGHFIPQHEFLESDTHLLRFEEGWLDELCSRYGLDNRPSGAVNASRLPAFEPNAEEKEWISRTYAEDFIRLGYG